MPDDARPPLQRAAGEIESAVGHVFTVHDVTLGVPDQPHAIRLRGHLKVPSHQAYPQIADRLREMGYTAVLRHDPDTDLDVLLAVPGVMPQTSGGRPWVNIVLYVLTVLSTLFVGASWSDQVPAGADTIWLLTHLWLGWPFALSLMTILTGHELGHYFAGRLYKVPVSLPYFFPMPIPPLGTMGAVIVMKGRSMNRRQMLTIGAAGPLTGLVLAVPILILGLSLSTVEPMKLPEAGQAVFMEGNSLLYLALKFAVLGKILPGSGLTPEFPAAIKEVVAALLGAVPLTGGYDVFLHPVALAGWAGLLVTAFNLVPAGQLDGGHVMYSLVGRRAGLFAWPIVILLVAMGLFLWPGWLLWAALIFLFGREHPEPLDDVTRLGLPQKILAVLVLIIFVLVFTPVPIQILSGQAAPPASGQTSGWLGLAALVLGIALRPVRRSRDCPNAETPSGRSKRID